MAPTVPSLQTHLSSPHVLREVPDHEGAQVKNREGSRGEADVDYMTIEPLKKVGTMSMMNLGEVHEALAVATTRLNDRIAIPKPCCP